MGDISAHFSAKEFRCKCHKCQASQAKPIINMTLVSVLEMIHCYFSAQLQTKITITINSGNRCKEHNTAVKGFSDSQHLVPDHGIAADIVVRAATERGEMQEIDTRLVYDLVDTHFNKSFGCHAYPTFTHIDVRPSRARW